MIVLIVSAAGTAMALMFGAVILASGGVSLSLPGQAPQAATTRVLTGAAVLAVVVPLLIAAASTGRMSAALRERRLSRLRLLGMSGRASFMVGLGECLPWAGTGWIIGALLGPALVPLLSELPIAPLPYEVQAPPGELTLASLSIPGALLLGATRSPRHGSRARSGQVADGLPGPWRAVPLLVGVGILIVVTVQTLRTEVASILFLSGTALAVIGAALVTPLLVHLVARVIRAFGHSATTIAGRRLHAQPGALSRSIGTLMIGLTTLTASQALIVTIESYPQYESVRYDQEVESSAEADLPAGTTAEMLRDDLRDVPGIRDIAVLNPAYAPELTGTHKGEGVSVIIASCEELTVLFPSLEGCRDDRPLWTTEPESMIEISPQPGEVAVYASGPGEVLIGNFSVGTSTMTTAAGSHGPSDTLFIPRSILTDEQIASLPGGDATITADPRPAFVEVLRAHGIDAFTGLPVEEYLQLDRAITVIRMLTLVVLMLGLGSFLTGALDRALERRSELARLRLLGTPVGTLRLAHALEVVPPLLIGSTIAVLSGRLIGESLVTLAGIAVGPELSNSLPEGYLAGPIIAAAIGSVLIALLTSIGLGSRIDPGHIRRA